MDRKDIHKIKLQRLSSWLKGEKVGPVKIDIEPTHTCNLKCKFCWTQSPQRLASCQYDKLLSNERILEIIDEAAELGVVEWQIAGGWEPIVNPKLLMKIAKKIKEHEMYGCITTNGTLFTEYMVKTLVKIEWDEILFSLEGSNAETHDYLTGVKGSFDRSTNAMKMFKKWKEELGEKKPNYSFHAVLTNRNYKQLADMVVLGQELGCTGVNFEPLTVWSEIGRTLKLDERETEEVKVYAKEALKVAKRSGIFTNAENLLKPELVKKEKMDKILKDDVEKKLEKSTHSVLNAPCFDPWLSLEIRVNGRAAPCRLCNFDSNCESVHEKSLKEIWFGKYFEDLRKRMIEGNMPAFCSDCAAGNVANTLKIKQELLDAITPFPFNKIKTIISMF